MRLILTTLLLAAVSAAPAQQGTFAERRAEWRENTAKATEQLRERFAKQHEVRSLTYAVNGQEVTRFFSLEETEDGVLRLVETETPGGRLFQHSQLFERTGDQSARVTHTGPEGRQAVSDYEWMMNELGFQLSKDTTGPGGRTASTDTTISRLEDGIAGNRITTGPGGRTAESNSSLTRTDSGLEGNRTVLGPDGRSYTLDSLWQKTEEGVNRSTTRTGPNGQQLLSQDSWQRTGEGGWTRSSKASGPMGQSLSRERTGQFDAGNLTIENSLQRSGGKSGATRSKPDRSGNRRAGGGTAKGKR